MHVWALGLSCETSAACASNTTKIPRGDTQRDRKKSEMVAGEGEKNAKFWASHPSGPQNSGPIFSGFGPWHHDTHTRKLVCLTQFGQDRIWSIFVLVGWWGVGKGPEGISGRRGFTRQPENSKRAHLSAPALQTPPKFHEKTPQREKERK